MIELPESHTIAQQLNDTIVGKVIARAEANAAPHKFAWYSGDPAQYDAMLSGKRVDGAAAFGGQVEIRAGEMRMLFGDGVNIRFYGAGEKLPAKHQLLVEFEDQTALVCSVQMYGGLWAFRDGENTNPYYLIAKEKPMPLTAEFDRACFDAILGDAARQKNLTAKGALATEQRIPGLGNGVLQDILYHARIHPKRKVTSLSAEERDALFASVKNTLFEMLSSGGRDTEKDLFGCSGGYRTKLSKNTAGTPCPVCGNLIVKEAYMGGSVYFCPGCQKQ